MTATTEGHRPAEARRRLGGQLRGSGVELGPGAFPFTLLDPGVEVRYVDRWDPDEAHRLFADDLPDARFTRPDVVADLNTDRLAALGDASQDFVIASHVLEHLVDPIGMMDEIHRVLRPGGLALIFLPSRLRTEDRFRPATPLAHLVDDHARRMVEVDEAHLVEFLRDRGEKVPRRDPARAAVLDRARRRSIHVHCWEPDEFAEVLGWCVAELGHGWEFVDGLLHDPPFHFEFGFLLRRTEPAGDAAARADRLLAQWRAWCATQAPRPAVGRRLLPAPVLRWARTAVRRNRLVGRIYEHAGRRHVA